MKPQIGCDPELFVFDKKLDRIVPAMGLIGGTKQEPVPLKCGGMVQVDGTVLEFGTKPVDAVQFNFKKELVTTLNEIRGMLLEAHGDRYELRCGAMAGYHAGDIKVSDIGLEVGCSPQYAFGSNQQLAVVPTRRDTLQRTKIPIGGHVHLGFGVDMPITDETLIATVWKYTTELTKLWGPQGIYKTTRTPADNNRLSLMTSSPDKALIRIKPYGFELRNLSSYWLGRSDLCTIISSLHAKMFLWIKTGDPHYASDARRLGVSLKDKFTQLGHLTQHVPSKYQSTLPLAF